MSDAGQRLLERAAAQGGLDARIRWITGRERSGSLTRDNIGLAAYAGDRAAQIVCGCCCSPSKVGGRTDCWEHGTGHLSIGSALWHQELAGWGLHLIPRVAVIVARDVLGDWSNIKPVPGDAMGSACLEEARQELRVIEATEAWLDDQSEEKHFAWWSAAVDLNNRDDESGWRFFARIPLIPGDSPNNAAAFLQWAVKSAPGNEPRILAKISEAIISWALREST